MEENTKRKVDLNIAGIQMSLITDESEAHVAGITRRMDEKMTALLSNVKLSKLDAALLCALDFCSDKIVAEKRLRNLEAQVSLYEVNLRRLKNEVTALKNKLGEAPAEETPAEEEAAVADEQIKIEAPTRDDKLRQIESLLRK